MGVDNNNNNNNSPPTVSTPSAAGKGPDSSVGAAAEQREEESPLSSSWSDKVFGVWPEYLDEEYAGGWFRGTAIAMRKLLIAKGPAMKQTVRSVGQNRPLAFASEGAVAGDSLLPRFAYYGAWTLSGAAIAADIYNKQDDAPLGLELNTALYWTAFHVPASLVVPALIIHQVVHQVEKVVSNPTGLAKTWSPRMRAVAPVAAALLSIIPVVPVVDHVAETIMEPTLGKYLGLEFHGHQHGHHHHQHTTHDHKHDHKEKEG